MITKQKNHKQSWARHWKGALVPMIRSTPISLSLFVSYLKNIFLQMKKDFFKNILGNQDVPLSSFSAIYRLQQ